MPVAVIHMEYEGPLFSPFSGIRVDAEDAESDGTLLFMFFGDSGEYGHISRELAELAKARGISVSDEEPEVLLRKLEIPGAIAIVIDAGWNGINTYCFAPVTGARGA